MATITLIQGKLGRKYRAQIRRRGKSETKTFRTRTDAKKWAEKREHELKEKPHLANVEADKHTLADAITRYESSVLAHMSESARRDRPPFLHWWRKHYGHLPLAMFQAPTIVEARDKLAAAVKRNGRGHPSKNGDTLKPASVNKHLLILSHLLTVAAKEWHWIPANPMGGVKLMRVDNARARFLSDDELVRLLDACRISEQPWLYEIVLLALTTAGRKSEVLGLTWQDVDLERRTVTYRHTKNGDTRTVSITPELVALLRNRRGIGKAFVFPAAVPGKLLNPDNAWKTALKRAEIEDFRFHDLRHSAASFAAMEGASNAELAAILGHRTLAMVSRYSHLSPDHVARVSARIGDRIMTKTTPSD